MYIAPKIVLLLHRCPFAKSARCHLGPKYVSLLEYRQRGYFDEVTSTTALYLEHIQESHITDLHRVSKI